MAIKVLRGEIRTEQGYVGKGEMAQLSAEEEKRLVAAGLAEPTFPLVVEDEEDDEDTEDLERMTVDYLRECARHNSIDLKGAATKQQIIDAIRAAMPES